MQTYESEQAALATCTGFHDDGRALGYFGFAAANYLVATGKWKFLNVHCWGYILERRVPPAIQRLIDETRREDLTPAAYNRCHNRHMRSL